MDRKWRRRSVESVCKERVRAQNCKEVARNWESKWRIGSILSPKYFVQDSYNLSQRVYSTRKCARKIFSSLSNNGYFTEFFEYNEEQRGDEREKIVGETRNLNQVRLNLKNLPVLAKKFFRRHFLETRGAGNLAPPRNTVNKPSFADLMEASNAWIYNDRCERDGATSNAYSLAANYLDRVYRARFNFLDSAIKR